jgi:hypothetical protein
MTSIADLSVTIQTSSRSVSGTPPWFGEAALLIPHRRKQGVINTLCAQVQFARRRFGRYEVLDFVAVLWPFCGRARWVRHQRRTDPRSVLRTAAALGDCLHGALWTRLLAFSFGTQSLFGSPDA